MQLCKICKIYKVAQKLPYWNFWSWVPAWIPSVQLLNMAGESWGIIWEATVQDTTTLYCHSEKLYRRDQKFQKLIFLKHPVYTNFNRAHNETLLWCFEVIHFMPIFLPPITDMQVIQMTLRVRLQGGTSVGVSECQFSITRKIKAGTQWKLVNPYYYTPALFEPSFFFEIL